MTININNIIALGTGVLGSQIAYQTAYSGLEVTAYDISEEIVKTNRKRFEELATRYEVEVEGARGGRAQAALARINYSWNLADAVRDADLVIESAPERLDVKRALYTKLGPLAPERTIFATNSSTLLPSALADATGRPDRFLALHFANEIWIHNIAEIMGHPGTDPAVYERCRGVRAADRHEADQDSKGATGLCGQLAPGPVPDCRAEPRRERNC